MKIYILSLLALVIMSGCLNTGQQSKDCGYEYTKCLLPAEQDCTLAHGRLDNGDVIIYEQILGPSGDNCKINMKVEHPSEVNGLEAACEIPKNVISTPTNPDDLSFLCKYCKGTMVEFLHKTNVC